MTARERRPAALRAATRQRKIAELRRNQHLVALALQRPADQLLIDPVAVGIRSDHEIDAQVDRAVNGCDRFLVVGFAVADRHAHATESDGRNFRSVPAELAFLHCGLL
ncbi:hypothetical protein D3C83_24800 [compost metagenome]